MTLVYDLEHSIGADRNEKEKFIVTGDQSKLSIDCAGPSTMRWLLILRTVIVLVGTKQHIDAGHSSHLMFRAIIRSSLVSSPSSATPWPTSRSNRLG